MSEATAPSGPARGRSFGPVANAYDRARPSYPDDAVAWLVGPPPSAGRSLVLELGAGTGKLTEVLQRAGHEVIATDPLLPMLTKLSSRLPIHPIVAGAEQIPLPSRSVDVVVCGQSFHWFDHERALPEIARVLRAGGSLAVAWNTYDTGIPWVKRLAALLSPPNVEGSDRDLEDPRVFPFAKTPFFGFVEQRQFRFWQPHTAASLADLTGSISHVSIMSERDRAAVQEKVAALYADFGRGHDGMQVPYLTRCYRAVVLHEALAPESPVPMARGSVYDPGVENTGPVVPSPEDPGMQLIDFR